MSNQLRSILDSWYPQRDAMDWVLATVIDTQGPCYRKTGAMMMVNELGQWFGLLSGGCLESDIIRHCQKVMHFKKSRRIIYDSQNDEETAWLLGIGCGGKVEVYLQSVNAETGYQNLDKLFVKLQQRKISHYRIELEDGNNHLLSRATSTPNPNEVLDLVLQPPPAIVIFGCGQDAYPLINICAEMGWEVTVLEHRINQKLQGDFPDGVRFIKKPVTDYLSGKELPPFLQQANAVVIMTHNLTQDACALNLLDRYFQQPNPSELKYMGLLGPVSRKQKVIMMSDVSANFPVEQLKGPVGLDLGGELPESIALSIVAEIQMVLGKQVQLRSLQLQSGWQS